MDLFSLEILFKFSLEANKFIIFMAYCFVDLSSYISFYSKIVASSGFPKFFKKFQNLQKCPKSSDLTAQILTNNNLTAV